MSPSQSPRKRLTSYLVNSEYSFISTVLKYSITMVDDIDDLLDECETKFCDSSGRTPQKSPSKKGSNSRKKSRNEGTSRR